MTDETKEELELSRARIAAKLILAMNDNDKLRAENAELRKDKERLDWIDKGNFPSIRWIGSVTMDGKYPCFHTRSPNRGGLDVKATSINAPFALTKHLMRCRGTFR